MKTHDLESSWKEEFNKKFSNFWMGWVTPVQGKKELEDFISKEIIEKIIEDIGTEESMVAFWKELPIGYEPSKSFDDFDDTQKSTLLATEKMRRHIDKQLRDKWLGKEQV